MSKEEFIKNIIKNEDTLDFFLYKMYSMQTGKNKNKLETLKDFIKENEVGLYCFYKVKEGSNDKNM